MYVVTRVVGSVLLIACSSAALAQGQAWLIDGGSQWRYWDRATSPGRDWFRSNYRDTSWKTGATPLGYGEPDIATQVDFGNDPQRKRIATFFRREFVVASQADIDAAIWLRLDDGCVVYLNGQELYRFNLPAGAIDPTTTALQTTSGLKERIYHRVLISRNLLLPGKNILAVGVRQVSPRSSDLYFDLGLQRVNALAIRDPRLQPAARGITEVYYRKHYVGAEDTIPDGYLDGGRGMQIDAKGRVHSGREVILVDRRYDAVLRRHLSFATSKELQELGPLERATRIARYIDSELTPQEGRDYAQVGGLYLTAAYAGQAVMLGDVPRLGGGGVCRHRSLLFKIMADAAGLKSALVRGNFDNGNSRGGHAWNELFLNDGRVLVDVMNPQPDFHFPHVDEPLARGYLTPTNEPYYGSTSQPDSEPANAGD